MAGEKSDKSWIRTVNLLHRFTGLYYILLTGLTGFAIYYSQAQYLPQQIPSLIVNPSVAYGYFDILSGLFIFFTFFYLLIFWLKRETIMVQAIKIKRLRQGISAFLTGLLVFFILYGLLTISPALSNLSKSNGTSFAYLVYFTGFVSLSLLALSGTFLISYAFSPGLSKRWRSIGKALFSKRTVFEYEVFSMLKEAMKFKEYIATYYSFLFLEANDVMYHMLRNGLPRLDATNLELIVGEAMIAMKLNEKPESDATVELFSHLENLGEFSEKDTGSESVTLLKELTLFREKIPSTRKISTETGLVGIWESRYIHFLKKHPRAIEFILIIIIVLIAGLFFHFPLSVSLFG